MKTRHKLKAFATSLFASIAETFTVSGNVPNQVSEQTQIEPPSSPTRLPNLTAVREKKPLQREVPPGAEFPVDALGEILGEAAVTINAVVQAPLGICGASVLAAAGLAAQAHANISIDGREFPISTFFITVGGSGERKTAVDNIALKEVRSYEERLKSEYDSASAEYSIAADAHTRLKNEVLAKGTLEERISAGQAVGSAPRRPLDPSLLITDLTIEGLLKSFLNGMPSQGIFADEAAQVLGGHAMRPETMALTLAQISNLWDGKAIERCRAGEPRITIKGKRCSLHLMAQPEVVKPLLANPLALDQGFLSRCLLTWPESTIGTRFYPKNTPDLSPLDRFHERIRSLLERAPNTDGDMPLSRAHVTPRQLVCSEEARRVYIEFHDHIEREMVGDLKEMRGFSNKSPEHLLRVAGILELVQCADATMISEANAINARELVKYFLSEARRVSDSAKQDPLLTSAQRLLDFIEELGRPVSLIEIYQCGPSDVRNAKRARQIAEILVDHGHIVPARGVKYRGQVRREAYKLTQ